jgi:uncharacterized protein YegP (UPF0339 family)
VNDATYNFKDVTHTGMKELTFVPGRFIYHLIYHFHSQLNFKIMAHPEFQVSTGKDDKFYFNLTAKNGLVIFSSQGYRSKDGCKTGIESVIENSSNKKHFERKDSKSGQFYFVLKAANSKVIGKSQMYTTHDSAENGIESIKTNARLAEITYL